MDFIDTGSEKIYSHNLLKKDSMDMFMNIANKFDFDSFYYDYFATMEKAVKTFCERSYENLDSYKANLNIIDIESLTKLISMHLTLHLITDEDKLNSIPIGKNELVDTLFDHFEFTSRDKRLFSELKGDFKSPNNNISIKYKSKLVNEFIEKIFRERNCKTKDKINLNENIKQMTKEYFKSFKYS